MASIFHPKVYCDYIIWSHCLIINSPFSCCYGFAGYIIGMECCKSLAMSVIIEPLHIRINKNINFITTEHNLNCCEYNRLDFGEVLKKHNSQF